MRYHNKLNYVFQEVRIEIKYEIIKDLNEGIS